MACSRPARRAVVGGLRCAAGVRRAAAPGGPGDAGRTARPVRTGRRCPPARSRRRRAPRMRRCPPSPSYAVENSSGTGLPSMCSRTRQASGRGRVSNRFRGSPKQPRPPAPDDTVDLLDLRSRELAREGRRRRHPRAPARSARCTASRLGAMRDTFEASHLPAHPMRVLHTWQQPSMSPARAPCGQRFGAIIAGMDEGTAALVAGFAGLAGALGGALIGAVAAIRGARIGAEKAAEAARQQVQDQASADHNHWLRQQRLEAYTTLLSAYDAHVAVAFRIRQRLTPSPARTPLSGEELQELLTTARAIRRERQRVKLVGPGLVHSRAVELEDAMWSHRDVLMALTDAVNSSSPESQRLYAEERDEQGAMASTHDAFVRAVGTLFGSHEITSAQSPPAGGSQGAR